MTQDELRLLVMRSRRDEMIEWLIREKKFTPKGARKCVDGYLETMAFVLRETGSLPY